MCKKNKIDAVKAVCNNAARKLAVLGLAVAVSSSAVANANPPKKDIPVLPSTMRGEETLQERLLRLERERDEKMQQAREKRQQAQEKEQQAQEKDQQATAAKSKALSDEVVRLLEEAIRLSEEAIRLNEEVESLSTEALALTEQIAALRAQIESEQQEEPVEEIVEVVPEDDEMKEGTEEPRQRNQRAETTNSTALQGLMPNVMNLPEQVVQQRPNQQQTFCCASLMPLDLSKFYGKK